MMQRLLKETARYILYYMTLVVVVTSVLFIVGIKISCMNVIIPMFMISVYYILRKDITYKDKIIIVTIASIIVTLSVMMSMGIYDFTVDGNAYHKQAVGLLKDGWNPVYQVGSQYNELVHSSQLANDGPLFWSEVYPKATWYYAAAIYAITEKIEAGKSYMILFIFVVFGYSYDFFYKVFQKRDKSIVLSLIMVANPIVLAQLGSYYLDGLVALVLSLLAIIMIDEVNAKEYIKDKWTLICLLVWGCNLKFSVILFVVTYCLVYIGYRSLNSKRLDWRNMILLGTTGLFSIFVVGNSPYYTNLKRYGNMLYGLEGVIGVNNGIQGGGYSFLLFYFFEDEWIAYKYNRGCKRIAETAFYSL